MPYANDDGISPWYNVNGTGEPLDRWVDDLAVVLDHAGLERVHLSRTSVLRHRTRPRQLKPLLPSAHTPK